MAGPAPDREGARRGGWRLAGSTSAYLRGASEQPIEWYPWGSEAFEAARSTHRPILLDVGAVWCHWCHVMDETTYSDRDVARLIGAHFIAVKVDRDEHPEIDRRYQRQVGALTGEGGWPLTAFLNAEGEVFLGGTFFPPDDGHGRPGFRRVLGEIARVWSEEPERLQGNIEAIRASLGRLAAPERSHRSSEEFIEGVRTRIRHSFDPIHAGFGHAPKFPHPTAVEFLLLDGWSRRDARSDSQARETLLRMADGGMYDHLGGGFHRYSVDEAWHIPHFEKMGADNAALLGAYASGAIRFGEPRLVETVRGTLDWVRTTLGHPEGGFGASQDADNAPGDDGGFFTWSRPEMKSALSAEEYRLASRFFGLGTEGTMPHDPERNVLYRAVSVPDLAVSLGIPPIEAERTLAAAIGKLRRVRSARRAPVVDLARYASLNGAFVRGLVMAARALDDAAPLAAARQAADLFLSAAVVSGRGVAHRIERGHGVGFGLLDDTVEFAYGLVELAGATAEPLYARAAEELLRLVDREFRGEDGLLRDVSPKLYDGPSIGTTDLPSYPIEDSPHLAANSAAALAFIRFGSLTGQLEWTEKARALLAPIQARIGGAGLFAAGAGLAAALLEIPTCRIVIQGDGEGARKLARAASLTWYPNLWVFPRPPPAPFGLPDELSSPPPTGVPRALVCFGNRCLAPITDPTEIRAVIDREGRPNATG